MTAWAVIERHGSCWEDPGLPEGCTVADQAGAGGIRDRTAWFVIRCENAAALTRLRQQEDDWPYDHGDDEDLCCHGGFSVRTIVNTYNRAGEITSNVCLECGQKWTPDDEGWDQGWNETSVTRFRTRREASEYIDNLSLTRFLGMS